jgi:predicted  nucleic acid-binding Zn-ribbon protein
MEGTSSERTESDLQSELSRLAARLAQGQRDHQRSLDELHLLETEIRHVESELLTLQRESGSSPSS